jgi:hypothetical protein
VRAGAARRDALFAARRGDVVHLHGTPRPVEGTLRVSADDASLHALRLGEGGAGADEEWLVVPERVTDDVLLMTRQGDTPPASDGPTARGQALLDTSRGRSGAVDVTVALDPPQGSAPRRLVIRLADQVLHLVGRAVAPDSLRRP